jgi:hypothetical protein
MATTTFYDGTIIEADWLNDVDEHVYESITAKAWGYVTNNGATATLVDGSNVASVVRNGEGDVSVTFTTAPADANYAILVTTRNAAAKVASTNTVVAASFKVLTWDAAAGTADDSDFHVVVYW